MNALFYGRDNVKKIKTEQLFGRKISNYVESAESAS